MSATGVGRSQQFGVTPAKPKPQGPETVPWWWHPGNPYTTLAPADFRERLAALDPNLAVTWNPVTQRWQLFVRAPQVNHPLCQGWRLLFVHHDGANGYCPLDERIFARIYAIDARHQGDAKRYFDRVVAEMERDKERAEAAHLQESIDIAMPHYEYSQIKNIGNGSKFATYFS